MKRPIVLLIDGDIIAYKHAAGAEVATDWGDDVWSLHTDTKQAIQIMEGELTSLCKVLQADKVEIALSGKNIFRTKIFAGYKSNRKKSRKPIGLPALREHLRYKRQAVIEDELEADDLLGIWATDPTFHAGAKKIIVSIDKDMKTVPCYLWNQLHPEHGVLKVSKKEADKNHYMQTLMGDATDGYAGCPSYGPTKSRRLIDSFSLEDEPAWDKIVGAYKKQGLTEEDALVQARLARILRVENFDRHKKTIKLWTP